jgi:hypothetical protein
MKKKRTMNMKVAFVLTFAAFLVNRPALDTTTGLGDTLFIENDGGVLTLGLSDQGY